MKRILICMLSIALIIACVLIYQHLSKDSDNPVASASPTPAATHTPLVSADPSLAAPYELGSYAPIEPDNTTGFETGWYTGTSVGSLIEDFGYEDKTITVVSGGADINGASFYRDGIPFTQGTDYTVSFTASSSVNRTIQVDAVNVDTKETLASSSFAITAETAAYTFSFSMTSASTYNGRLAFRIGNDGTEGTSGEHTVTFSSIRILPSIWITDVKTNQFSYFTDAEKRCTFSYDAGDVFDVINTATGEVVYTGAIVNKVYSDATGETDCYGDFTNVTEPGTYAVHSQIGTSSYTFSIGTEAYTELDNSLLRMISMQRCGEDLNSSWAGELAHAMCHTETATIYGTEETIDVTGGWHDAGDYGRYIKTGAKTVNDLLFSYMGNPNLYSDSTNGPDSDNGTADILDEARYELEWMLKMQDTDGGVYNKVLTTGLADTILPEEDTQDMWVLEKETTSTADFAGSMAIAALAYKDIDTEFSNTCLDAAVSAYSYLKDHPDLYDAKNPDDVTGGAYIESSDTDGRFTAAIALYIAAGETDYLSDAKDYYAIDNTCANGIYWNTNGGYGRYLYLVKCIDEKDTDFYASMMKSLAEEAGTILAMEQGNSYNASLTAYTWGSNGITSDNGIILAMYYDMTNDMAYLQAAYEQVSYLLGRNSLHTSFVSGYGTYSPQNVHSRIAKAKNTILPGALAGGPNASKEDPVTIAMADTVPAAKAYADSFDSYSTNEIAIYWNSSLIHLLSKLR